MLVLVAYLASLGFPGGSILFWARSTAVVNHGLRIPFAYFLAFDLQTVISLYGMLPAPLFWGGGKPYIMVSFFVIEMVAYLLPV
ncbi:hypothetical protein CGRA01v4_10122 [Colletotrichum graminicola]|nr:hypothetical protein CGRA01v4_10122 [Colletotrichum graminicola]